MLGLFLFIVLVAIAMPLMARTFLMYSDSFRAKYYHHLDEGQIQQIIQQPQDCWFTSGVAVGQGKKAVASLQDSKLVLDFEDGDKKELSISEIKKTEIIGVGWLAIYPTSQKAFAVSNDGRWGIFFGTNFFEKAYGNDLPFPWQPHARQVKQADKIALAFLFSLQQLKESIALES
jgi:hypothetical protein